MVTVYILQCKEGKYYVGKTNNIEFRIEDHFCGEGSEWTSIFDPICLIEIHHNCDKYDEDKYTFMYMDKYGIDNVRGGSFTKIYLEESDRKTIMKILKNSNDKCHGCGQNGHYVAECPNKNQNKNLIKKIMTSVNPKSCYRCGRMDHWIKNCNAINDINGKLIQDYVWDCDYCYMEFDTEQLANLHQQTCVMKFK